MRVTARPLLWALWGVALVRASSPLSQGLAVAIVGRDCVVIAADATLRRGATLLSSDTDRITKVAPDALLAAVGDPADGQRLAEVRSPPDRFIHSSESAHTAFGSFARGTTRRTDMMSHVSLCDPPKRRLLRRRIVPLSAPPGIVSWLRGSELLRANIAVRRFTANGGDPQVHRYTSRGGASSGLWIGFGPDRR